MKDDDEVRRAAEEARGENPFENLSSDEITTAAAAGITWDLYSGYLGAGFSEKQALYLTAVTVTENPLSPPMGSQ